MENETQIIVGKGESGRWKSKGQMLEMGEICNRKENEIGKLKNGQ